MTLRCDPQVRDLAASKGKAAVEASGAAKAMQLLPVLIAFLDVDAQRVLPASRCASLPSLAAAAATGAPRPAPGADSRQDRVKAGVVGLLAALSGHLSADGTQALLSRLTAWLSAQSDLIQCALGDALPSVVTAATVSVAQRREIVSTLLERVRARLSVENACVPADARARPAGGEPRHCIWTCSHRVCVRCPRPG